MLFTEDQQITTTNATVINETSREPNDEIPSIPKEAEMNERARRYNCRITCR